MSLFFREDLVLGQNWVASTELPYALLLLLCGPPTPERSICWNWGTCTDTSFPSKAHSLHQGSLTVAHPMGLYKCAVTHIHHYSVIQISYTGLNILWASPIHPPSSLAPGDHCSFYCLHSFVFSKCYVVRVI